MNETPAPTLDQAAFQRVWRRVMPQDRPDCPFTLEEPALTPTADSPQPLVRSALSPLPAPVQPPQSVPCLGEASVGELPTLEARMDEAAQAQQAYQALARRAGRRCLASSLAEEKGRQVQRLNAAHFLISGQDYDPQPGAVSLPATNALAIRERFRAEQLEAAALMDAAQASADPCLSQLYRELAEQNREHTDLLRRRLEQR